MAHYETHFGDKDDSLYDTHDFLLLISFLEAAHEDDEDGEGLPWENLMYLCFLGGAICAQNAELTPDDFMEAVRGIRVTEQGIYGDA